MRLDALFALAFAIVRGCKGASFVRGETLQDMTETSRGPVPPSLGVRLRE